MTAPTPAPLLSVDSRPVPGSPNSNHLLQDASAPTLEITISPAATPTGARGGRAAKNRRERERKARRRPENRRIIASEKARGCWLCSRRDLPPAKLHFHHLRGKKKDKVCNLVSRSVAALTAEIRGCTLICRDCHEKQHDLVESEVWQTGGCYDL